MLKWPLLLSLQLLHVRDQKPNCVRNYQCHCEEHWLLHQQQAIVLGFSCYARLTRWFRDENNNIVTAFVGRRHLVVVVVTVLDYFLFHCSRPVSELSGIVVELTQVPSCLVDRCFRLT